MSTIMVVDFSGLAYDRFHSLNPTTPSLEKKEFRRAVAGLAREVVSLVNPDHVVFALDSRKGYWRSQIYGKWYGENCLCYEDSAGKLWMKHDNGLFHIIPESVLAEDMVKVRITSKSTFDTLPEARDPATKWWKLVDFLSDECPASNAAKRDAAEHAPKYKGHRKKSTWTMATPKSEFTDLRNDTGHELARIMGSKSIEIQGCEADDVAAEIVRRSAGHHRVVLVTGDSDWDQLTPYGDVHIWNIRKGEFRVVTDPVLELRKKILAGDGSDNIAGIALPGATTCIAEKGAEKLLAQFAGDPSGIKKWAVDNKADKQLDLNVRLVDLRFVPQEKRDEIWVEVCKPTPPAEGNWASMGFTEEECRMFRYMSMASQRGQRDTSEGPQTSDEEPT